MIKIFTKIILILFIAAVALVFILLVTRESRNNIVQHDLNDVRLTTATSGRFLEHILSERVSKLYGVTYHKNPEDLLQKLAQYADFVSMTYGYAESFNIGHLDSGFRLEHSFDSGKLLCKPENMIDEQVASRLTSKLSYIGPAPQKCAQEFGSIHPLMLLALPIYKNGDFAGAVYELSPIVESAIPFIVSGTSGKVDAMLVYDDMMKYERGSLIYNLLSAKEVLGSFSAEIIDGKAVGFHSFYIEDSKLCFIFRRELSKDYFTLECCPSLEKYRSIIFTAPFLLLFLWLMLEMLNVNEKLGREIQERTKHLESIKGKYQRLFDTIPEYVVLYKFDGEILECNEKLSEILGGNPIGANIIYFIREKDRFKKMINDLKNKESGNFGEYFLLSNDTQTTVSVNSCLVDTDGRTAILSIMTDITEYKKIKESVYQSDKKEALGTLAAGISHDFSNIMQNLALQFRLLEKSEGEDRNVKMERIRNIIATGNTYLSTILSYAKRKDESQEILKGSEFVTSALEIVEMMLPADIRVHYEDFSGDIKIKSVKIRMFQALLNLCENASDAMGKKGDIFIRTYVENRSYGHFFCISVKDSGEGIQKSELDKIFKPFYTTKQSGGTGLGLAIVKKLVMDSGGFIEVTSEPGKETEFILMFAETK